MLGLPRELAEPVVVVEEALAAVAAAAVVVERADCKLPDPTTPQARGSTRRIASGCLYAIPRMKPKKCPVPQEYFPKWPAARFAGLSPKKI